MPEISVIMGVYNEKNHNQVVRALDSILMQTFSDFEFIICDDGSEEEEYWWLKKYSEKDQRIQIIRQDSNQGLAAALNTCLKKAQGKYIARMDADDIARKDRLEKEREFLDIHKEYALVGSNAALIDEQGTWWQRTLKANPKREDFLFTSPFIHPAIMMRKEVYDVLCGYSTEKYALRTEDYDLFMRMYAKGYRGANIQENLLCYREDRNAYGKRKYRYRINEMKVRYKGFKANGILKGNLFYVITPLVVGLIPVRLMQWNKKRRYKKC